MVYPRTEASLYSTKVKNKAVDSLTLACWRETGADTSCLRRGSVPRSWFVPTGVSQKIVGVGNNEIVEVPEYFLKIV